MRRLYTLDDLDLGSLVGIPVFVRVDFNVPLAAGRVGDASRLRAALPTLRELKAAGARLLLGSHCGRPKGTPDPAFSLRPVAAELGRLLGEPVRFAEDCVGVAPRRELEQMSPGDVCLLENLRFHPGEKANDPGFASELAALASAFVNDAFGTAHRAHASVVGIPEHLRRKAAGRLMLSEVEALGRLLEEPERPFVLLVGGAKIAGKAATLENLLPRLDRLLLGGGMANTFLAALGHEMGRSLVESERLDLARSLLERAATHGVEILLPEDLVVTEDLAAPAGIRTVPAAEVPPRTRAVDIGEATCRRYTAALASARTLFWNGPMGVFETPPFDAGTRAMAAAVAACSGFTAIGGGETVAAAREAGVTDALGHVSTGGGASLELLAGRALPGLTALERKA